MSFLDGSVQVDIPGRGITKFVFGMGCLVLFCKDRGIPISDIDNALQEEGNPDYHLAIRDLFYHAACFYCELHELEVDFTKARVLLWLNLMSQESYNSLLKAFWDSQVLGKSLGQIAIQASKAPKKLPKK